MSSELLIDNDVIKKLAVYGLFEELQAISLPADRQLMVLGAAPFVLSKAIEKSKSIRVREAALGRLQEALALCEMIEPGDDEVSLAASLEDTAQRLGLPFDQGESLLIAALVFRASSALITGDKRALGCTATVIADHVILSELSGRIACLEQVLFSLLGAGDGTSHAQRICQEPDLDRAISICFGCASSFNLNAAKEGLQSYIESVRQSAEPLLADGVELSGLL
jgi:hypothetical protein